MGPSAILLGCDRPVPVLHLPGHPHHVVADAERGTAPGVVGDESVDGGGMGALGLQGVDRRLQQLRLTHAGLGLWGLRLAHDPVASDIGRALAPIDVRLTETDHFRGAQTRCEVEQAVITDLVLAAGCQDRWDILGDRSHGTKACMEGPLHQSRVDTIVQD